MYENGNIHTTDLLKISALSASSFYKSLAQVIDAGLVTHFPDPDDSRKTINHIKDEVRIFLDQIHLELSDWAASI